MKEIPLGNGLNAKVDDEDFAIAYSQFTIDYCSAFSLSHRDVSSVVDKRTPSHGDFFGI